MEEKLSLFELQLIIKDSLYAALPGMYWVVAEISEIKENYAGHCYLELVEKHPDDEKNIRARVRGIIWNKRFRYLKPLFENITGELLKEGQKILIKVTVEYHEIYGLSLIINDIDPAFTIGEMALKRQRIIQKLEEEGVITMNKELEFPIFPKRIAVISSKNAAGYSDFIKHLTENKFGYTFQTLLFDAVMQRQETEISIVGTLDRISRNLSYFDVVVIIRGGGSQTDLSWFDNYNIAYHITQFPIPVITGIGHEKDLTVTDIVAWRAEKTPTAVADFLVNCFAEAEDRLAYLSSEISELTRSVIEVNKNIINSKMMQLIPVARLLISSEKEKLAAKIFKIINIAKELIVREEMTPVSHASRLNSAIKTMTVLAYNKIEKISGELKDLTYKSIKGNESLVDTYSYSLGILDPENVLRRGYSITSVNGRSITGSNDVRRGDIIDTKLYKGSLKSKVTGKSDIES
jgi:exodeoxyribonuclease VII large subunit